MTGGLEYLNNRGISDETIKDHGLMYFLNGTIQAIPGELFNSDFITKVKPMITGYITATGDYRMNNCVLLPLLSLHRKYLSIFARRLSGEPKFDAFTYNKKAMLYGLYESHPYILNKEHAYIVEGIFDYLVMWQFGIRNIVCTLGCSLHYDQMCLLGRFTKNVTVIYDPDVAGKDGMFKAKDLLVKHGYKCQTVYLPEGLDLDDFILKYGVERLLKHAKTTLTV